MVIVSRRRVLGHKNDRRGAPNARPRPQPVYG